MTFPLTLLFILLVFWRPQEWLFPWMFGWPLLQIITYISLIGLTFELDQKSSRIPKTPAIWLAVGLWVSTLMSHVANTYFQGLLFTYLETFKLCFFLVLLLVVTNSIRRLQWIMIVFLMGGMLMAIHAILQDKTGSGFAGALPINFYNNVKEKWITQTQFFGIFGDPNDMGQFLATCIPLVFAVPKRFGFVSCVLAVAVVWLLGEAMLSTHSRGTLIGLLTSVLCIILLWLPSKWMPYFGVAILIGGLIACALGAGAFMDQSARDRVVFWGDANRYFKSHPLFGGGYGMFGEITGTDRASHNAYVCCYTELGLFGYWFWFNIMTLGVIGCWRTRMAFNRPRTPEQAYLKRVSGLCIAALVGFAVSAYFLSRAYVFPLFFLFGLLAVIPIIAERYLPEDHPPLLDFRKDVILTGTVSSLGSVVYVYISILLLNRVYGG
ncbi:MAG: O-antigen ligase family protein [Deltaproteobacteria bacterium]